MNNVLSSEVLSEVGVYLNKISINLYKQTERYNKKIIKTSEYVV